MSNTEQLIHSLALDAAPVTPLRSPAKIGLRLGAVLLLYAVVAGLVLGVRPDITVQLHRPFFLAEIFLLSALICTSLSSAVLLVFPDQYQHSHALRWPAYSVAAFVAVLMMQIFLPGDAPLVIPEGVGVHGMECAVCIASVATVPSAVIYPSLRRGASVYPVLSGSYGVLAAAGIGCLVLRLSELNDSIGHLALWHYLPTLLFAILGALLGKYFLKW